MQKKNYAGLVLFIIIIGVIAGIVISINVSKANLRESIVNERKFSAEVIENTLPGIITESYDYIEDSSAGVELLSYRHTYKDSEGKPAGYIQWEDNITLICNADDSFNKKTDSYKLECFKNITGKVKEEAARLQTASAPVYDEYYSRSEIVNVFEEGVFCQRNVEIRLTAGENKYIYHGYSWHISEAFTKNGEVIDLTPGSTSGNVGKGTAGNRNTGSDTKGSGSKTNKNNSGSAVNNSRTDYSEYPDCDDYESWDEFMDDWDGLMPDDADASDYWDNW